MELIKTSEVNQDEAKKWEEAAPEIINQICGYLIIKGIELDGGQICVNVLTKSDTILTRFCRINTKQNEEAK